MLLGRREHLDDDHRLLTWRLRERGVWMADVRHADGIFYVFAATVRVDVAPRAAGQDRGEWVDTAVDCVIAELGHWLL